MKQVPSLAALLLLLICGLARAEAALSTEAATRLLAAAQADLAKAGAVEGRFEQTQKLTGIPAPLVSRGHFLVARDLGVLWAVEQPFASTTRLTAAGLMQDSDGARFALDAKTQPGLALVTQLLGDLFTLRLERLAERFTFAGGELGAGGWQLLLTPRDAALAKLFSRIQLTGATHIQSVQLQAPGGDVTRIQFSSVSTAATLSPTQRQALVADSK